jgi:hypothetical protein
MKKQLLTLAAAILMFALPSFAQLSDEEYSYVTMDLQGILDLTMTTDPQVDFSFKTIQQYQNGITKYNAVRLEVDATVAWDLFAYASTDDWTQVDQYSTNGEATLPAEILEIKQTNANTTVTLPPVPTFDVFHNIKGLTNSGVTGGTPDLLTNQTQFLAGAVGTAVGESYAPGTAEANPTTNKFRLDYRIKPGVPATFPNLETETIPGVGFAQAGYYYLEVVYSLAEDL